MRTFLVNLDDATDPLAFMTRQAKELGLNFERISAVNGKKLTGRALREWSSPLRQIFCRGYLMARNEVACAASHLTIYKKMIDEQIPLALILEDDMRLLPQLPSLLSAAESLMCPERVELCLLSVGVDTDNGRRDRLEVPDGQTCAGAYIVTLAAGTWMYHVNRPIVSVSDNWTWWKKKGLAVTSFLVRGAAHWDYVTFGTSVGNRRKLSGRVVLNKGLAFLRWMKHSRS